MAEKKNVTVYSTPTCPYCRQVKDYLSDKGIAFIDYNVADNVEARTEMIRKSGQMGVPVVDVEGTTVVGFNRTKLDELLS